MHKWLIGLLFIGLINCTSSNRDKEFSFHHVVTLESKTLGIGDVYMHFPYRVRQVDSLLYISDLHTTEFYCHAFHYPSMRLIKSFAKRGEAPNEYQVVENLRVDDNTQIIWILDSFKKNILSYNYKEDSVYSLVNLNEELIMTLDFSIYQDSLFIVPDYTGENRVCIIDMQGNINKKLFSIPDKNIKDEASHIPYAQAWRPFIDYNKDHNLLAMVTQLGQTIELYDLKADTIVNIITGEAGRPKYRIKDGYAAPNGIMGYSDVHVGTDKIYALFWGHEFKEIRKGNVKVEGGNRIHVFDLKGNPEIEYILDSHITGFHINEKEKKIIGLDVNSNQPVKEFSF